MRKPHGRAHTLKLRRTGRSAGLGVTLLACTVAPSWANPCPPVPGTAPPPYGLLTGSVTVVSDSIGAGNINICGISGGILTIAGTLTDNGMLVLTPGGGEINVLSGGQWVSNSGAMFAGAAGSISNAGTISNAGILDPTNTSVSNTGTIFNLAGGQLFSSSTFSSSGNINNDGDFRMVGGIGFLPTLTNSGVVTNSASGSFSVILTALLTNSGTFNTLGIFHNTGAITNQASGQFTNGGVFVNGDPAGAVTGSLANAGTFVNTGAAGSFANSKNSTFTNNGTLRNELGAGFTNSGNLTNSGAGATLVNSGTGTMLSNLGALQNNVSAVINNVSGAVLNNAGTLAINGGILNNGATLNNLTLGTISNAGALFNVNGTLANGNGATVNNTGTLENSSNTSQASGVIDNHGTLSNSGSFINHAGGLVTNQTDGTLQNQSNGIWTNEAGAKVDNDGTFTNAGTVRMTGSLTGSGTYEQTAGLTKMLGGTIQQTQINILGGQLLGAGTLAGSVTVAAGATIGAGDPNHLAIQGPLSFSGGNLLVQIAGAGQYDAVGVTGGAVSFTGGTITFQFLSGFTPTAGMSFAQFLTADGGITGLGSVSYSFLGLDQAPAFQVLPDGVGLDLVVGTAPVPEPATWLLLTLGVSILLRAHRARST